VITETRDEVRARAKAELDALRFAREQPDSISNQQSAIADEADRVTVRPVIVRLSDVQPEAVTWLWPGRLAAGKLTLLVGDPGLGKSWITLDIAAHISTGTVWPDGGDPTTPCNVLLLSAEDGLADTIRPRLDALGADVTRVHHLAVLRAGDAERAVQLADTAALEQAITETDARVMIIDPVSAYLGSTDSHRDAEVRGLMAPLALLAERTGVAVLGVMHLAKSAQRPAIYRAVGSIAFAAAARIVLAVAADPERAERRIVAPIKSNLSAPPAALAYTLADGRLIWETDPVSDVDVDLLLSGPASPRDRDEQTDAEQVIQELLEDEDAWPLEARTALLAGEAHGVHQRTLRRTAQRLKIRIVRVGFGASGRWVWHRPQTIGDSIGDRSPRTDTVSPMSSMANPSVIEDTTHIGDTQNPFPRARDDDERF
jgi:hypothetical protein